MSLSRLRLKWFAFLRWLGFGRTDAHYIKVGRQKLVWRNDLRAWEPVGRRFWIKHWASPKKTAAIEKYTPSATGSDMEVRVVAVREKDYLMRRTREKLARERDAK